MRGKELYFIVGSMLFISILFGILLVSVEVSGSNNATVTTKVNITNSQPTLYSVDVSPTPIIDLTPGGETIVNCTGLIYDVNGWGDIEIVNATLYDISYGDGITSDNNYRYLNASCNSSCVQYGGDANNASCTCSFKMLYYANNGSWQCNMSVRDSTFSDSLNSSLVEVSTVIGIGTPNEIDYGGLSVTEISPAFIPANISNFGNVPINISLRGWGGDNESVPGATNLSMICEYGNISYDYQRYSLNTSVLFSQMNNLSNVTSPLSNFDLPVRTEDITYGNDTNATYWKIEIPADVGGTCNGTVQFLATETII